MVYASVPDTGNPAKIAKSRCQSVRKIGPLLVKMLRLLRQRYTQQSENRRRPRQHRRRRQKQREAGRFARDDAVAVATP